MELHSTAGASRSTAASDAHDALRASETRLQLALDAGDMGAWQWNLKTGAIVWWSGMDAVHGLPPDLIPRGMDDYACYIHPEDRGEVVRILDRALLRTGRDHRIEYRIVWPDGSIRWVEGRARIVLDSHGEPAELVGICMDITRRKRTELGLRFLAQASAELAELVDPQVTFDRIVKLATPAFADWCAVDLLDDDGQLQRVAAAHVDPDKTPLIHEVRRRFPSTPDSPRGPWSVLRSGRTELVAEIGDAALAQTIEDPEHLAIVRRLGLRSFIGVPLATRGRTIGVVYFVSADSGRIYNADDVALAEDLARRAAVAIENGHLYRALQDADRRKDVFLATLAHELRNPLAPIANAVRMARHHGIEPRRIDDTLRLIERQTDHLVRLVDDLLDISRVSTGKIELRRSHTTLASVLGAAIETSRPHIDAAGHRLHVTLPDGMTDLVADPVRLSQVFANLLNNAAKFTPAGGRIDVVAEASPEQFVVRVRDSGIGIAPGMLRHIFTVFTQVGDATRRTYGGLGIGLSLVDELVRLHGGSVAAYSEGPGRGSEFVVRLPRHLHRQPAADGNPPRGRRWEDRAGTASPGAQASGAATPPGAGGPAWHGEERRRNARRRGARALAGPQAGAVSANPAGALRQAGEAAGIPVDPAAGVRMHRRAAPAAGDDKYAGGTAPSGAADGARGLPAAAAAATDPVPAPAAARGDVRRVLVVDDNIDGATTIAEVLRMLGHVVEVAHDGPSAVRGALNMRPDVILLDIGLPGMDGYEAARRIRAQEAEHGGNVTLIALTGWGQDKDRQRSREAGFNQHWVKPVDFERLKTLSSLA